MNLIDKYLLKEWLKCLFVALLLTLGILVLDEMYKHLKTFIEQDASIKQVFLYYLFIIPPKLRIVLPIALLISILYVLNEWQSNNEIAAMRASGMTIFKITRVLWISCTTMALVMFFLNAKILPYTTQKGKNILDEIKLTAEKKSVSNLNYIDNVYNFSFFHPTSKRIWYINRYSFYTNEGNNAIVIQLSDEGKEIYRLKAKTIKYSKAEKTWTFYNAQNTTFDLKTNEPISYNKLASKELENPIETPNLFRISTKKIKHLSFNELKTFLSHFPKDNYNAVQYRIKYYEILASPMLCIIVVLLAIPFALGGVRTNPAAGVTKAYFWFFLYYLFSHLSSLIGSNGYISPMLSAILPSIIIGAIGIFFYKKLAPR